MMNVGGLISNEHGYSGMQGRGFFAGVSGYGFHAEYSQNGGFDWGGSSQVATAKYDSEQSTGKHVSGLSQTIVEKTYEKALTYTGLKEEFSFSDVDSPTMMITDSDGDPVPEYSEDATIEGHTHNKSHSDMPTNVDNKYAYNHPDKRHVIINSAGQVVEYRGVPYDRSDVTHRNTDPSPQVINVWSVHDVKRGVWSFNLY